MTYRDRWEMMLRAMPGTLNEIAARTGIPKTTVKKWTSTLRAIGWAHVPKWRRCDGPGKIQPVITGGPGRNVPCNLEALTPSECQRNSRARANENDPFRHGQDLARRRARDNLKRIHKRGKATPFDALMG